jgi:hypothetical protein
MHLTYSAAPDSCRGNLGDTGAMHRQSNSGRGTGKHRGRVTVRSGVVPSD